MLAILKVTYTIQSVITEEEPCHIYRLLPHQTSFLKELYTLTGLLYKTAHRKKTNPQSEAMHKSVELL